MKQRSLILILLLCFGSHLSVQAQVTEADTGKLEMLRQEASRMISFWGFALNTLGDPQTPLRDKETIIFESYSKIFLNEHVQIEDDLIEGRSAVTNKDVQAYLKDVDFFFQSARFAFTISEITHGVSPEGT
ncbi:MAG: leucine-rich repeat domain-containing protein, partial [Bacteroidetes bacterium]